MAGWVKLHRKLLKWEWYQDANTFRVFMHLLLTANHDESRYMGYVIPRGSVVIGRKALAKTLGLTEQQIRTALKKLKTTQEINQRITNRFSIITILNYNDYQTSQNEQQPTINQQITSKQPTDNQQITTSKEDQEGKKGRRNPPTPLTRGEFVNIPIPSEIDTEDFRALWLDYFEHRNSMPKRNRLTRRAAELNLKDLAVWGHAKAVRALRETIKNGWQGVFEPKQNGSGIMSRQERNQKAIEDALGPQCEIFDTEVVK